MDRHQSLPPSIPSLMELPPADSLPSPCTVPRLLADALSGALSGALAVVGAFTGALAGALAGKATESGVLRGAGLGAVAGAVLSVEVLEASRAYWCSEPRGSHISSTMADFMEELLNGRFVQEQVAPTIVNAQHWQQVNISEMSYEELYGIFGPGEVVPEGVSKICLERLPSYFVTDQNCKDSCGEAICCIICLQELLHGETIRCLPLCHHIFHMTCVDKWLLRQGSCPVCRACVL